MADRKRRPRGRRVDNSPNRAMRTRRDDRAQHAPCTPPATSNTTCTGVCRQFFSDLSPSPWHYDENLVGSAPQGLRDMAYADFGAEHSAPIPIRPSRSQAHAAAHHDATQSLELPTMACPDREPRRGAEDDSLKAYAPRPANRRQAQCVLKALAAGSCTMSSPVPPLAEDLTQLFRRKSGNGWAASHNGLRWSASCVLLGLPEPDKRNALTEDRGRYPWPKHTPQLQHGLASPRAPHRLKNGARVFPPRRARGCLSKKATGHRHGRRP